MKIKTELLQAARDYVFAEYNANHNGRQLYHDFLHTEMVVAGAQVIGAGCSLDESQMEDVLLAAWFHDVGFVGTGEGHEAASAKIARSFLTQQQHPADRIARIEGCINATKMPQQPANLLESVICDADLHYLGTKDYVAISDLLRAEWEFLLDRHFTDSQWIESQIAFLSSHKFHTEFAALNYAKRKSKNITRLSDMLKDAKKAEEIEGEKLTVRKQKLNKQKEKEIRPDRGIETMFRITSRNHMELSAMADNKANIMISINAIIISITLSTLVPKFDKNIFLVIPTFVLLSTCLLTIIFATISTRPKISGGTFTKEDLKLRKVNLLFFGNFFRMTFDEFNHGMTEMMQDKTFLYGNMVKDIYSLGLVLSRKYRLIRISYNVFMYGLILTVLAFAITFYAWNANGGAEF